MERSFTLYVLIRADDEVVLSSFDENYVGDRCEQLEERAYASACEDYGRDPDDLTPEEAGEIEWMQGSEGEIYNITTIDIPAELSDTEGDINNLYKLGEEVVTLDDYTEVYISDLIDRFVKTSELDEDEDDYEDDYE